MTLSELIQAALEDLNRDIDQQNREEYESRLARYINDAYSDMVTAAGAQAEAAVTPDSEGCFERSALTDVSGITGVSQNGKPLAFYVRPDLKVKVLGGRQSLPVNVVYEVRAPGLRAQSDTPRYIPAEFHGALADYAVYRELLTGSVQRQTRAMAFKQSYDSQRSRLKAANASYPNGHPLGGGFTFGRVQRTAAWL